MKKIPKELLKSAQRREMWKNALRVIDRIEKVLPISSVHLRGSFKTKKKRPADVDFIVLLKTRERNPKAKWSVDFVIAPDNKYGKYVLDDATKWMKQKYGSKKSSVIKLR